MILIIFAIVGFVVLRFAITLINFLSSPTLPKSTINHEDMVSILIPARNEEDNILTLLQSIIAQDYTNYEVIVLDDSSTDRTFEISYAFAAQHRAVSVWRGEPLAAGWLGKNYACHQLAQKAKGQYLLFLDADDQVYNGLINSAINRMKTRQLGLLSLFVNQQMLTTGEKLVVPLMNYLLLSLLPIRLIYSSKNPGFGVASGQFMLFDASCYHQYQWHQAVKAAVVEDLSIMKLLKAAGLRGEGLMACGLISCRMYKGYIEAVYGFSKNFLSVFDYSKVLFMIYITLLIGGLPLVFAMHQFSVAAGMCVLIISGRVMESKLSGQSIFYNVLLHPLQMLSLIFVSILAIKQQLTGTAEWKGRRVKT